MTSKELPILDNSGEVIAIIEIPKGSDIKFEMDAKTGRMKIDRFITNPGPYPFNYGFIENTLSEDGDALDVLVLSDRPLMSGSKISCRPIGLLQMEDEKGKDTKILAILINNAADSFSKITDIREVDLAAANKIRDFFKFYKKNEPNKWSRVYDFLGAKEALAEIRKAAIKKTQD